MDYENLSRDQLIALLKNRGSTQKPTPSSFGRCIYQTQRGQCKLQARTPYGYCTRHSKTQEGQDAKALHELKQKELSETTQDTEILEKESSEENLEEKRTQEKETQEIPRDQEPKDHPEDEPKTVTPSEDKEVSEEETIQDEDTDNEEEDKKEGSEDGAFEKDLDEEEIIASEEDESDDDSHVDQKNPKNKKNHDNRRKSKNRPSKKKYYASSSSDEDGEPLSIIARINKWDNFEHAETNICFDFDTHKAIGIQNRRTGKLEPLNEDAKIICDDNGWLYDSEYESEDSDLEDYF